MLRLPKFPALRLPKFPALGGRGTPRAAIEPCWTARGLLNPGRELLTIGRELVTPGLELLIIGRRLLKPLFGLATLAVRAPRLNPPRAGAPIRLTTGREKERVAGAEALVPRDPKEVRVGRTASECTAVIRLICFGETRMLFRATDREFTIVVRETAVKPPGRRIFA
jgi:hypothetical protein